jgi:hypothetical protein
MVPLTGSSKTGNDKVVCTPWLAAPTSNLMLGIQTPGKQKKKKIQGAKARVGEKAKGPLAARSTSSCCKKKKKTLAIVMVSKKKMKRMKMDTRVQFTKKELKKMVCCSVQPRKMVDSTAPAHASNGCACVVHAYYLRDQLR